MCRSASAAPVTSGTPAGPGARRSVGAVTERDDRLAAAAGLLGTVVVGVTLLVGQLVGAVTVPWIWWIAYGVYVIAFGLGAGLLVPGHRPWSPTATIVVLLISGAATWLIDPSVGWSAILLIVTAATAAYEWEPAAVAGTVVAQTVVLAVGAAMSGGGVANVVFTTLAYGAFQVFAVLVILALRSESDARRELAVAHAELRASNALLESSSRSAERLRIARELHDVIGHQLTALALELEIASHRAEGSAAEHIGRARSIAKDLLNDVRSTVSEMRATPAGLAPALSHLVDGVPGLTIDLTINERRPVTDDAAVAVVRCVQEILTNTLRHAGAKHLRVEVSSDDDGVRVRARDDGVGTAEVRQGHGLLGMTERAQELGGTVTVTSAPGEGLRVEWRVPA